MGGTQFQVLISSLSKFYLQALLQDHFSKMHANSYNLCIHVQKQSAMGRLVFIGLWIAGMGE